MQFFTPLFFILIAFFFPVTESYSQTTKPLIIAHRGGVVDSLRSENSLAGLEEAIKRGYTHVEIDARMTKDGYVICYHNNDLRKETATPRKIADMTLAEIQQIELHASKEKIPTFEEYCQRCSGRIQVMIDIKGCKKSQIKSYCHQIETALRQNDLLNQALILINQFTLNNQVPISKHFLGKAKISWRKSLSLAQIKSKKNPNFAEHYYVFNHGNDFSKESIQAFHKLGLPVIVSINYGHFIGNKQATGERLLQKNIEMEVDGFQIDSGYDHLLLTPQ